MDIWSLSHLCTLRSPPFLIFISTQVINSIDSYIDLHPRRAAFKTFTDNPKATVQRQILIHPSSSFACTQQCTALIYSVSQRPRYSFTAISRVNDKLLHQKSDANYLACRSDLDDKKHLVGLGSTKRNVMEYRRNHNILLLTTAEEAAICLDF